MKKIFVTFLIFIFSFSSTFANIGINDYVKISEEIKNSGTASINTIDSILSVLSRQELEKIYEKLSARWDYSIELKYMKLKISSLLNKTYSNNISKEKSLTWEEKEMGFRWDSSVKKWKSLDGKSLSSNGTLYFTDEEKYNFLEKQKIKGYYFDWRNNSWEYSEALDNSFKKNNYTTNTSKTGYDRHTKKTRELRVGEVLVGGNIKDEADLREMRGYNFGYSKEFERRESLDSSILTPSGSKYFTDSDVIDLVYERGYKWDENRRKYVKSTDINSYTKAKTGYDRHTEKTRELRVGEVLVGGNIKDEADLREMRGYNFGYSKEFERWESLDPSILTPSGSKYFTDSDVIDLIYERGYKWDKNRRKYIKSTEYNSNQNINSKSKTFSNKYFSFKYNPNAFLVSEGNDLGIPNVSIKSKKEKDVYKAAVLVYKMLDNYPTFESYVDDMIKNTGGVKILGAKKKMYFQGNEAYVIKTTDENKTPGVTLTQRLILSKDKKNIFLIYVFDGDRDAEQIYNTFVLN